MCKKRTEIENLFICLTPLQMYISLKLIDKKNIKSYAVVAIFLGQGPQYQYYFGKLAQNASFSYSFIPTDNLSKLKYLFDIIRFSGKAKKIRFVNIYLASIDNLYVQSLISKLKYNHIFTFDDGLANLNYEGSYYNYEHPSIYKKIILYILRSNKSKSYLRNFTKMHYSIYKDRPNISDRNTFLDIFHYDDFSSNRIGTINILIGQPLYEINNKINDSYINNVIKKYNIDKYIKHPREKYQITQKVDIVNSNLIFEDLLRDIYLNHSYETINVYSFCSTAIINIRNCSFVNTYILRTKKIPDNIYTIVNKEKNIKELDLDNV